MPDSNRTPVLILGATGNAGAHVVRHALEAGDDVHVLVRNPDKLPDEARAKAHVIVGDLTDPVAVAAAVTGCAAKAIIVCSGHPPKHPVTPLNAIAVAAIDRALGEAGRREDCRLIYLSGLFSDPPGEPLPWFARILRAIIVPLSGYQASLRDNLAVTRYLTIGEGQKNGLRYTIVRMGLPIEAASKGVIVPVDDYPLGSVTFDDMGLFLTRLAHGQHWQDVLGKAIKPFYAKG